MKRSVLVLWAVLAFLLPGAAGAQALQQLYVGGAAGSSKFTYDTGSLPIANATTTTFSVNDDSDTAIKVYGGWRFNPYFAAEVAIVDYGKFSATRSTPSGSARSDITVTGVSVDAVGLAPIGGVVELFGKVGLIAAGTHATRSTTGSVSIGGTTSSSDDTASSTGAHVAAGVNFRITSRVWARLEYERAYGVGDKQLGEGDVRAVTIGAAYRF
jgi:OmpA-OmpF porin, OOP family